MSVSKTEEGGAVPSVYAKLYKRKYVIAMEKLTPINWNVIAEHLGDKVMKLVQNETMLITHQDYIECELSGDYLDTEDGHRYKNLVNNWYVSDEDDKPHPKDIVEHNGAFVAQDWSNDGEV